MIGRVPIRAERGQGTVEWVGLVSLVSLLLVGVVAAAGARAPGAGLARSIVARLLCAADLADSCTSDSSLLDAYGPELAAEVADHAPEIVYEAGMTALPVDFRSCRSTRCANGPDSGPVWASDTGAPAASFVHAVDCRTTESRAREEGRGFDCSGERAGDLYIQFWLYYQDSATLRALPGDLGFHPDDWEGYQVRIGPSGTESRATSHHGYNYDGGPMSWPSDVGLVHRSAWGRATGRLYVSGGSHAGHVHERRRFSIDRAEWASGAAVSDAYAVARGERPRARFPRRLTEPPPRPRWTPRSRLELIPIETLSRSARRIRFAIVPPWRKPVYRDPEDEGT
ncbi:MAG TPA: hypothetical protein VKG89_01280 [Solirubrobacterales bacterium]|nr:hypothetical protein [Solirubrobacterales bacterium]